MADDAGTGEERGATTGGLDRRSMIKAGAVAGAAAWVVPQVVSMSAAAASSGITPISGCFNFDGSLDGWTGASGYNNTTIFQSGSGSLSFTALGAGGDMFSPLIVTNGLPLTITIWYLSQGGGGFFGLDEYSNVSGTGGSVEQWLIGGGGYPSPQQWAPANSQPLNTWQQYSLPYVPTPGTLSIRLKAEQFTGNPTTGPVFMDGICYSS